MQAFVLIEVDVGKGDGVAIETGRLPGVCSADLVTGPYDVILRAEVAGMRELAHLLVNQIQCVEGVTRTVTCLVQVPAAEAA